MAAGPQQIAEHFLAARRMAAALPDYPGDVPATLADAYAIQDAAIALDGKPIIGWKVGRIHPPLNAQFGNDRLAGPIFTSAEDGASMPVFAHGFAAAEAEFLLRVGQAPADGRSDLSLEEAAALVDAVHVGIEIASSPLPTINDLGPAVTISDFGNNHGLVIGRSIQSWRDGAYADWPVSLLIDGVEAGTGVASAMPDGPIGAVRFLVRCLAERGIALPPGTWISTGAVTGVHPVRPGQTVEARFGDEYRTCCHIEEAAGEA